MPGLFPYSSQTFPDVSQTFLRNFQDNSQIRMIFDISPGISWTCPAMSKACPGERFPDLFREMSRTIPRDFPELSGKLPWTFKKQFPALLSIPQKFAGQVACCFVGYAAGHFLDATFPELSRKCSWMCPGNGPGAFPAQKSKTSQTFREYNPESYRNILPDISKECPRACQYFCPAMSRCFFPRKLSGTLPDTSSGKLPGMVPDVFSLLPSLSRLTHVAFNVVPMFEYSAPSRRTRPF